MVRQPPEKVVRVRITGKVQGVWFRAWTIEEAARRGLDGWVRNRGDGTVEALFAGSMTAVDDMIAACHVGPPSARVAGVMVSTAADDEQSGFRQLPTR